MTPMLEKSDVLIAKQDNNLPKLPKGWACIAIKDSIEKIPVTGKKITQKEYLKDGRLPVIDQGQTYVGGYTDKENLRIHTDSPVVVFGDHTKVFKYVDFDFAAGADGIKVMKPYGCFSPKLFYYFLQAIILPDKGYARHFQFLEKSVINVPPLPEQHRIVAKIEELFTRLDAGVEALKKIKAELKRYRQSILKHAFEGKLTEQWRQTHKGELEPASKLLERIKKEREKQAKGKKQKRLPPLDTSELPELPEGWEWVITSNVCSSVRDGTHDTPKYVEKGVPLVTSKNLKSYGLDFTTTRNISIADHQQISIRSGVERGDVLFAMIGTVGNPVVVDTDIAFSIKNIGLFKKNPAVINSKYLNFWLGSWVFNQLLEKLQLVKGTTQRFVPLGHLRIFPVPMTSLSEQNAIVSEIERYFSIADHIEQAIEIGLKQSGRLRQSILKKAFKGKLVPQDPEDEPAEKLLERIKKGKNSI